MFSLILTQGCVHQNVSSPLDCHSSLLGEGSGGTGEQCPIFFIMPLGFQVCNFSEVEKKEKIFGIYLWV